MLPALVYVPSEIDAVLILFVANKVYRRHDNMISASGVMVPLPAHIFQSVEKPIPLYVVTYHRGAHRKK